MNRFKKLSRWSVVRIGLALLLGVGGLRIVSAAQSLGYIVFPNPYASVDQTCDGNCLDAYGTGLIVDNNWYNYVGCTADKTGCIFVWEFA